MTVRVKICGLTRKSDVELAVNAGADALGFIFGYPASPRNLNFGELKELLSSVPPLVSAVIVSPDSNPELRKVVELEPSFYQLYHVHGSKSRMKELPKIIRTVRPDDGSVVERCVSLSKNSQAIHFDMSLTSQYSTKRTQNMKSDQNWKIARDARKALGDHPMILSGGLTPENVADAIRYVRPYAVDVSSGVEAKPGIKDAIKVTRFIQSAKSAIN